MKRVLGIAAGLLLCAGTARADHGGASAGQATQTGACCVPQAQVQGQVQQPVAEQQRQQPSSVQPMVQAQPQRIPQEDWQGLAEYDLAGDQGLRSSGQFMQPVTMGAAGEKIVGGEVARVNLALGEVGLFANGGFITLRATPAQLATIQPGRIIHLAYNDFGGVPWVLNTGQCDVPLASFGALTTAQGTVTNVNKQAGLVALSTPRGDQVFLAHPLELGQVQPGEYVNLSYTRINNADWISSIQPQAAPPSTQE